MNSVTMNVANKQTGANAVQLQVKPGTPTRVVAHAGARYELDGVKKFKVRRHGDDLQLQAAEQDIQVTVEGYYNACQASGEDAACAIVDRDGQAALFDAEGGVALGALASGGEGTYAFAAPAAGAGTFGAGTLAAGLAGLAAMAAGLSGGAKSPPSRQQGGANPELPPSGGDNPDQPPSGGNNPDQPPSGGGNPDQPPSGGGTPELSPEGGGEPVAPDTGLPTAPSLAVGDTDVDGKVDAGGKAGAGSKITVTWPDGSTSVAVADVDGDWHAESPVAQPDGMVGAVVTDPAGKTSLETKVDYSDTIAPQAPTVRVGDADADGRIDAEGNAEPGSKVIVTWPDGSVGEVLVGAGGAWSMESQGVQGSGPVSVVAIDPAGNRSAAVTEHYAGGQKPQAPSLELLNDSGADRTDHVTNVKTVNVGGLQAEAAWEYQIDGGAWVAGGGAGFNLSEGAHTYQVRQTSKAGVASSETAGSFTLDTAAPQAPRLTLASDTGANTSDGITTVKTVNVDALESGAKWEYQIDGAGAWIAGSGRTFDLSNGAHGYTVRQTDQAGNVAEGSSGFTLQNAPLPPLGLSLQLLSDAGADNTDGVTNVKTVKVLGLANGATWQYQRDGAGAWINGSGDTFDLGNSAHTYKVRQLDQDGNATAEATGSFTLDIAAPAKPQQLLQSDSGKQGDNITFVKAVTVGGKEGTGTLQMRVDGGAWTSITGSGYDLTEGQHTYQVRQLDKAGNISPESAMATWTLDTKRPDAPVMALQNDDGVAGDNLTSVATVNVTGLEAGGRWQVQIDGAAWVNGIDDSFELSSGSHTYAVQQFDAAGNSSAASAQQTLELSSINTFMAPSDDDTVQLSAAGLALLEQGQSFAPDGGAGVDTLTLAGSGIMLDLTRLAGQGVAPISIERINLGSGGNALALGMDDVLNMSEADLFNSGNGWNGLAATESRHQLVLDGEAGDVVNLRQGAGVWTDTHATASHDGHTYEVWTAGDASGAQLLIDQLLTVHPNV